MLGSLRVGGYRLYIGRAKRALPFFVCPAGRIKKAPGGDTRGINDGSVEPQEPLIDNVANEDLA